MKITSEYGESRVIPTYWNGCKNSENLVDDRVPECRDSHASSSHEPSLEPMRSVDLGNHSVYTHFPERPKLRDLPEDQNHKGPVQKTYWQSRTSCTKSSVKDVNLETIIDMQSWCRIWPPNGSSRIRAKLAKVLGVD